MRETFQSQSQITHKSRFVWGGYSPCSNACRRVQIPSFSFSAYLQSFLSHWHPAIQGGSAPRSNPLPFYIPFLTEKVPLQYTFYWHWYPFHNPSLELCILLNCCKCTVFKIWINHKTRPFTLLFSQLWYICKPFLGFLPTEMTVFPILLYTSTSEIPNLSYTWGLKKVPLPGGTSPYRPF